MLSSSARLSVANRAGLALLCLILVASLSMRLYAYWGNQFDAAPRAEAGQIDLGDGVFAAREGATHRTVWVTGCDDPVSVDFIDPSPHGNDASLVAPRNTSDPVYYVYRGWTLHGRLAAMRLSVLHFVRQAAAIAQLNAPTARYERAVKLIVPARCGASPADIMDVLRGDVRSRG